MVLLPFSTLHATHLLLSFFFQKLIIIFLRRLGYIQSRKSLVSVTLAACPAASTIVMSSGIRHRKCSLLLPPHQKSRTMHHAYFCGPYISCTDASPSLLDFFSTIVYTVDLFCYCCCRFLAASMSLRPLLCCAW
jgi:hypothetical protein